MMRVGADDGAGELEVEFAERPVGWDPRTIVLMCCSRAVGVPAREDDGAASLLRVSGGKTTIGIDLPNFPRRAALTDESGQLRAEVSASSRTDLADQQPPLLRLPTNSPSTGTLPLYSRPLGRPLLASTTRGYPHRSEVARAPHPSAIR